MWSNQIIFRNVLNSVDKSDAVDTVNLEGVVDAVDIRDFGDEVNFFTMRLIWSIFMIAFMRSI